MLLRDEGPLYSQPLASKPLRISWTNTSFYGNMSCAYQPPSPPIRPATFRHSIVQAFQRSLNSFLFNNLPTLCFLIHQECLATPLSSIVCALFPVARGWGCSSSKAPPVFRIFFQVPYAPSPFVRGLLRKLPGCTPFFPKWNEHATKTSPRPRERPLQLGGLILATRHSPLPATRKGEHRSRSTRITEGAKARPNTHA